MLALFIIIIKDLLPMIINLADMVLRDGSIVSQVRQFSTL